MKDVLIPLGGSTWLRASRITAVYIVEDRSIRVVLDESYEQAIMFSLVKDAKDAAAAFIAAWNAWGASQP